MVCSIGWTKLWRLNYKRNVFHPNILRPSLIFSGPSKILSFSTTVINSADRNAPPKRGANTLKIKKKAPVRDKGRPPSEGERKALRKRIVLSNSNALDVKMPEFNEDFICKLLGKPVSEVKDVKPTKTSDQKTRVKNTPSEDGSAKPTEQGNSGRESVASIVALSDCTVDSLRALQAFKITQSWSLFRRPSILIRNESKILTERLLQSQEQKTTLRMMIDGAKGTGKSMMLLHAMATALVSKWLVIHIPEAQDVTNAVTEYAPIPGSNLYSQNTLSAELLSRISKANAIILRTMKVRQSHSNLPYPLESNCSVYRLCELGSQEPEYSWPFFLAFWSEITAEENPPILMCLDGISYILQNSLYVNPDLSYIHSQDLAIVRHFTDHLSGAKTIPNGGAFIAATNRSHAPVSPSLELAITRSSERALKMDESQPDPFEKKYDSRSDEILSKVDAFKLGGLSKDETRSLLEYWAKSGVLRSRIDEKIVAEKWVLAGHGNAGEIQRGSLWMRS
ncbi:37S ribosomal protein S23, mitochondrial [Golovinomyces cichoracearum]|uniref:Small ribosomal subunit protein mS29 n=1 Tax=Golovinomyces cichoracearum TaxID=62708 RepID=A0A420HHU7_9PEZI|nr:37S ribosomal protein S23, mitochondrial [Golovinomyces cichoracearum]